MEKKIGTYSKTLVESLNLNFFFGAFSSRTERKISFTVYQLSFPYASVFLGFIV